MLFLAIFAVIAASAIADPETQSYSYSPPAGSGSGSPFSIIGEGRITAVRVWESSYIRGHYVSVVFITSKGRHLEAGQPSGTSFDMYPSHKGAELVLISGTTHGGITSIAALWGRNYSAVGNLKSRWQNWASEHTVNQKLNPSSEY
ncbi:hypothetical protein F7725_025308 [Dissostichus mawsoni]|uniref:Jacalin-type lectin domain-containing protein n=1 Tax=Dissostichus mawsoni TaxID=36200 RepID=A0A7J5XAS3_DISMA|nr:hypothetical protein F7725_025308 [Dissostichus mawsoni]